MLDVIFRASYVDKRYFRPATVTWRDWLRAAPPRLKWVDVARYLDFRTRLGEVRAPTLVLAGRHDPQMPPACAAELAAGIPGAQLVVFERSGHYPFVEEPESFWAAVGAFLDAGPPAARSLAVAC
jgi:proline iminopeptidase